MKKIHFIDGLIEPDHAEFADADLVLIDALKLEKSTVSQDVDPRLVPVIEAAHAPTSEAALEAAMAIRPTMIVLRGLFGVPDIQQISSRLAVQEAERGWADGAVKILAVMGDTAASIRALTIPWPKLHRLEGFIFSPLRLQAALSRETVIALDRWPDPLRLGRSLTVLMANDIGVPAYEWLMPGHDEAKSTELAQRDGFSGTVTGSSRTLDDT